jgi:hypothetical protein
MSPKTPHENIDQSKARVARYVKARLMRELGTTRGAASALARSLGFSTAHIANAKNHGTVGDKLARALAEYWGMTYADLEFIASAQTPEDMRGNLAKTERLLTIARDDASRIEKELADHDAAVAFQLSSFGLTPETVDSFVRILQALGRDDMMPFHFALKATKDLGDKHPLSVNLKKSLGHLLTFDNEAHVLEKEKERIDRQKEELDRKVEDLNGRRSVAVKELANASRQILDATGGEPSDG